MSFPARITGVKSNKDGRRDNKIGARKIPNAKKPNSRPSGRLVGQSWFPLWHPYGVWASRNYYPAEWLQG